MRQVALGIGCDRGASPQTLEAAIRAALGSVGLGMDAVGCAASIDAKRDEPGLIALAGQHGWPLRFFTAAELAEVPVPSPSETVRRIMGTPAVAEAAALLAAVGPETARQSADALLVEKHKHRGADCRNATIAVARIGEPETDHA